MHWQVGVICGPRSEPTLARTLASLAAAGFPPARVFADGQFDVPDGYALTRRIPKVGGWPNFLLALHELVARDPKADVFVIVQDDVVFCRGTCEYVSAWDVPDDCGVLSLFTPACNNGKSGWHDVQTGYGMASAQAFAFPRERAFEFLAHPWTVNHRRAAPKGEHYRGDGLHHIDGAVGEWCRLVKKKCYNHNPSLSQHVGETSIMCPGFNGKRNRRFSDSFPGESVHAQDVLGKYARDLSHFVSQGCDPRWIVTGDLWARIAARLRPGLRTLEMGSGLSTKLFLDAGCRHTALEHDPEWLAKLLEIAPQCREAVHLRPLVGDPAWYDWEPPAEIRYDLVLIDGPPATIGRSGVLRVIERLIHSGTTIYLDDVRRAAEGELCTALESACSRPAERSTAGHFGFAIFSPRVPAEMGTPCV